MPPAYVKPYVKRQKNDMADAEAICEAVPSQYAVRRDQDPRTTKLSDAPSHAPSVHPAADRGDQCDPRTSCRVGIVAPVGRNGVEELFDIVVDSSDKRLPDIARTCLAALGAQLRMLKAQVLDFDRRITAWHRSSEASRRLDEIPGVGPMLATALVASVGEPSSFRSGRDFSAWIGLVPKQRSSGGKDRLGSISKQGDRYLRSLFMAGALAVIRYAKIHGTKHRPWLTALLARRPTKVAAIALANKIARMAWATLVRRERYKEPITLAR
jgi:transposase